MRISGNLLILNERRHIHQVIHNFLQFVDELIILDGGSTDGTVEYIRSIDNPRITLIQWPQDNNRYRGNFREVARRNLMIEVSSGEYILTLDADELISDDLQQYLRDITGTKRKPLAIAFPTYNFYDSLDFIRLNNGRDTHWYPNYHIRFFRNTPSIRYATRFRNGLHCSLHLGNTIPLKWALPSEGPSPAAFLKKFISLALNTVLTLMGKRVLLGTGIHIFHYHYANQLKENDLRTGCKDKQRIVEGSVSTTPYPNDAVILRHISVSHPSSYYVKDLPACEPQQ